MSFDDVVMPVIDSCTRAISTHPDSGTRLMRVTIWQKYDTPTSGHWNVVYSSKIDRLTKNLGDRYGKHWSMIIFDEKPAYARKKAYVTDPAIFDKLEIGKAYDLRCVSRSWECGYVIITEITTQYIQYVSSLLRALGIVQDLIQIIVGLAGL